MSHTPTGFPRGRPRKGEIRPPTPGGVNQALWRARQKEKNLAEYLQVQADYQRLWHLANPGAKKKSNTAHLQRKELWDKADGKGHKVYL